MNRICTIVAIDTHSVSRFGVLVLLLAVLWAPCVWAQNNNAAAAQTLFDQGRQAMEQQNHDAACGYFNESNRLDPAVGTQFNLALCERRRGNVASSWALYRGVLQQLAPNDRRVAAAERAVAELEAVLPKLSVAVAPNVPAEAKAYRNDTEVSANIRGISLPVDPGTYVLRLEAPGYLPSEVSVDVALSESKSVVLELGPAEPPAPGVPATASTVPVVVTPPAAQATGTEPGVAKTDAPRTGGDGVRAESADGDIKTSDDSSQLPRRSFNFSLLHPIGAKDSDKYRVDMELGLVYSYVGALDGVGVTLGVLRTRYLGGVALAGAASIVEGPTNGVSVSYFLNVGYGPLDGVRVAGLGNVQTSFDDGEQTAEGVHVAGMANIVGQRFKGVQVAAVANVALAPSEGVMVAALGNLSTGGHTGTSIGASNVAGSLSGLQLGAANVSVCKTTGAQVGAINVGGKVRGVQVGVVNIAQRVDGVSIGILPISIEDGIQPTVWTSTAYPLNVGLRFSAGLLATTLSASYEQVGGVAYYSPGISLGGRIPWGNFYLEPDVGYRMDLQGDLKDFRRRRIPYRLAFGWQPHRLFRAFVGGGVLQDTADNDAGRREQTFRGLGFAGVSVLHSR